MPDNLVFAGTPDFALASLKALVQGGMAPALVLTQPDRRAGRGRKIVPGPVKRFALEAGLPLYQPQSLKEPEVASTLAALQPVAIVVAAYGLLFPPGLLELPNRGCVNVHASLLPRWRGAAPVQAAIRHGDEETGISLMQMERGLDTGPVFARESLLIGDVEPAGMLQERLAALGGEMLLRHLPAILDGTKRSVPQDERIATYAPKISQADARLDWRQPALALARSVRAYDPQPGAWFLLDGERLKCWTAEPLASSAAAPPGTVLEAGRAGIDVACGEGCLRLLEVQRAGRRPVRASELASQRALTGVLLPA